MININNMSLTRLTQDEILDLVGVTFVIEALILSENMRDARLTDLDQGQVENLTSELYHSLEIMRSAGEGYIEMSDSANNSIDKHLSERDHILAAKVA